MCDGPLFLTGASGFVGRAVVPRLAEAGWSDVRCLVRTPRPGARQGPSGCTRPVVGDLTAAGSYRDDLPEGGTVVHLAALTGKASARRHHAVNAEATRRLVDEARAAGVERFVFMSSIVAGFPDRRAYPYAQAKAAAEVAVREGGMRWVILRPTQVFGPGSPVLAGLTSLASTPLGLRFGRGTVRMQPIDVDDVARAVVRILDDDAWDGRVVDLGGPDVLSAARLLEAIRLRTRGRPGPWLPVPLAPVRWSLALVEPLLHRILPLTAGQLAPFADGNHSAAAPAAELWDTLPPRTDLAAMLDAEFGVVTGDVLDREFRAFARYLARGHAPAELSVAYRRAHGTLPELRLPSAPLPLVDRAALTLARIGGPALRVADAYGRVLRPSGPLRAKLVLALALLEHAPPHHTRLATAATPGPFGGGLRLVGIGLAFGASLAAGLLLLGPLHLVSRRPEPGEVPGG